MNLALHNFEVVRKWLRRKRPGQIDCQGLLAAWNMFSDVSASVGGNFDPDKERTQKIYQKLFWGSNLPAITRLGKHPEPLLLGSEVLIMRQVLGDGLALFRSRILANRAEG